MSPTDVHLLVGLLTLASSPDDVEVELGSMVMDAAAEEKRDVDVTVKYQDVNGSFTAMIGREVKAHNRPLDVGQVIATSSCIGGAHQSVGVEQWELSSEL